MKPIDIKIEMNKQVKFALQVLMEKINRQLPDVKIKSIIIKDGEISVKE